MFSPYQTRASEQGSRDEFQSIESHGSDRWSLWIWLVTQNFGNDPQRSLYRSR
jgi:hypothetical protein